MSVDHDSHHNHAEAQEALLRKLQEEFSNVLSHEDHLNAAADTAARELATLIGVAPAGAGKPAIDVAAAGAAFGGGASATAQSSSTSSRSAAWAPAAAALAEAARADAGLFGEQIRTTSGAVASTAAPQAGEGEAHVAAPTYSCVADVESLFLPDATPSATLERRRLADHTRADGSHAPYVAPIAPPPSMLQKGASVSPGRGQSAQSAAAQGGRGHNHPLGAFLASNSARRASTVSAQFMSEHNSVAPHEVTSTVAGGAIVRSNTAASAASAQPGDAAAAAVTTLFEWLREATEAVEERKAALAPVVNAARCAAPHPDSHRRAQTFAALAAATASAPAATTFESVHEADPQVEAGAAPQRGVASVLPHETLQQPDALLATASKAVPLSSLWAFKPEPPHRPATQQLQEQQRAYHAAHTLAAFEAHVAQAEERLQAAAQQHAAALEPKRDHDAEAAAEEDDDVEYVAPEAAFMDRVRGAFEADMAKLAEKLKKVRAQLCEVHYHARRGTASTDVRHVRRVQEANEERQRQRDDTDYITACSAVSRLMDEVENVSKNVTALRRTLRNVEVMAEEEGSALDGNIAHGARYLDALRAEEQRLLQEQKDIAKVRADITLTHNTVRRAYRR